MRPPPEVKVWPRGGAKSTTAELGVTFAGRKRLRSFALYISGTQDQANLHVSSISSYFETAGLGRATDRYGVSRGWRVDLLRVANGFNVLALGLDAAARGIKLERFRPDFIILDDIDGRHDSEKVVKKKIATLSQTLLPMGSADAAILVIQNLVHENSIVSQLASGKADFLHNRRVDQEPAVADVTGDDWLEGSIDADGLRHYKVVKGRATWSGQDLATVEQQVNAWGRLAFLREAQHDLTEKEGGLWNKKRDIDPFRDPRTPRREDFEVIKVGVDPNASEGGDEAGIIVAGRQTRKGRHHATVLEDNTVDGGPKAWATAAVEAHLRWQSDGIVAEANNGGDMVAITIGTVENAPRVTLVHASRGKKTRAAPIQKLYEEGRVHHAGVFVALEAELCGWLPGEPSPNRLDANVWVLSDLLLTPDMQAPWFPSSDTPPEPDEDPDEPRSPPSRPTPPVKHPARPARRRSYAERRRGK